MKIKMHNGVEKKMSDVDFYLLDLKSKFDKLPLGEYYLSYSGGRDSHFLFWFIKEYLHRDDIKIVGVNTYMEHKEILDRIYKNCDVVLLPEMKPFEVKEKYGSPCFSKTQDDIIDRWQRGCRSPYLCMRVKGRNKDGSSSMYGLSKKAQEWLESGELHKVSNKCCECLKKRPAHEFQRKTGLKPILGIRGGESIGRRGKYKSCFMKDGTFTPIWDLPDELMSEIINEYKIEVPRIYDYVGRTGCAGCVYGTYKHETAPELLLVTDNQFKFLCEYFKESYDVLEVPVSEIAKYREKLRNKELSFDECLENLEVYMRKYKRHKAYLKEKTRKLGDL